MQIDLNVVGKNLYRSLDTELSALRTPLPRLFQNVAIGWSLHDKTFGLTANDLVSCPERPGILLIEASDMSLMRQIQIMEKQRQALIRNAVDTPLLASTMIMAFAPDAITIDIQNIPDCINDWIFLPLVLPELTRRIFVSLKRKSLLKSEWSFGSLRLLSEARMLLYEDKSSRLTPSENLLMEAFLNHPGKVLTFDDLAAIFRNAGKSTEANNIRVAVFQLRLKLEMMSKHQIRIDNVYRKGYCLRKKPL